MAENTKETNKNQSDKSCFNNTDSRKWPWFSADDDGIQFCKQNNNRKVKKNIPKKPEHGKKYVFLAKCIENALLREKYCPQNRGK